MKTLNDSNLRIEVRDNKRLQTIDPQIMSFFVSTNYSSFCSEQQSKAADLYNHVMDGAVMDRVGGGGNGRGGNGPGGKGRGGII